MFEEDHFFDVANMACPACTWLLLMGSRGALCKRCTPLVRTPGYLGPLPILPATADRRDCWGCRARQVTDSEVLMAKDPALAKFCRGCTARAEGNRKLPPLEFDRPQVPRTLSESEDSFNTRRHWFG